MSQNKGALKILFFKKIGFLGFANVGSMPVW